MINDSERKYLLALESSFNTIQMWKLNFDYKSFNQNCPKMLRSYTHITKIYNSLPLSNASTKIQQYTFIYCITVEMIIAQLFPCFWFKCEKLCVDVNLVHRPHLASESVCEYCVEFVPIWNICKDRPQFAGARFQLFIDPFNRGIVYPLIHAYMNLHFVEHTYHFI